MKRILGGGGKFNKEGKAAKKSMISCQLPLYTPGVSCCKETLGEGVEHTQNHPAQVTWSLGVYVPMAIRHCFQVAFRDANVQTLLGCHVQRQKDFHGVKNP